MAVLCVLLTTACGFDYCRRKIPNGLLMFIFLAGMGYRLQRDGPPGILLYLGQTAVAIALLYPLFKIGTVGAGDVKLLGVTAGYLPFQKVLLYFFFSLLVAAIISLGKLLINKNFKERLGIFVRYLEDTAKTGILRSYSTAERYKRSVNVCLSGPMMLSLLLYLGGVY